MALRRARPYEVLATEQPGFLSREACFAKSGAGVQAADVAVPDTTNDIAAVVSGTVILPNSVAAGTLVINGKDVVVGANVTPAQLVTAINTAVAGPVVASLDGTGKLVLTAADNITAISVNGPAAQLNDLGLREAVTLATPSATVRYVPLTDLTVARVADAVVVLEDPMEDGGFAAIVRLAEVKDNVVRWPEHRPTAALARAALARRSVIAR